MRSYGVMITISRDEFPSNHIDKENVMSCINTTEEILIPQEIHIFWPLITTITCNQMWLCS